MVNYTISVIKAAVILSKMSGELKGGDYIESRHYTLERNLFYYVYLRRKAEWVNNPSISPWGKRQHIGKKQKVPPPPPPIPFKIHQMCQILLLRLKLMGAPGVKHEPCSYPAVLSSSFFSAFAHVTQYCTVGHWPSDQWDNT
jgi:hypothetical protein